MTKLTTQQAAEVTGKARSTIWRAIKNGKLSAEKGEAGDYLVDASELERWRSSLAAVSLRNEVRDVAMKPDATNSATARNNGVDIELATLRERTAQQERLIEELRTDREKWRAQAETATRLLTDQRERRVWWRWWRGR
jgi:excisionase family DNA binding protein